MNNNPLSTNEEFSIKYHLYGNLLFRIAIIFLGNKADAEEAFAKLLYKAPIFENGEHEKSWMIRVITNICKNMVRSVWHKRVIKTNDIEVYCEAKADLLIIESVLKLPVKYKAVIHLYYYEDYSVKQISEILKISESAVKMRLKRGRELLKFELEDDFYE